MEVSDLMHHGHEDDEDLSALIHEHEHEHDDSYLLEMEEPEKTAVVVEDDTILPEGMTPAFRMEDCRIFFEHQHVLPITGDPAKGEVEGRVYRYERAESEYMAYPAWQCEIPERYRIPGQRVALIMYQPKYPEGGVQPYRTLMILGFFNTTNQALTFKRRHYEHDPRIAVVDLYKFHRIPWDLELSRAETVPMGKRKVPAGPSLVSQDEMEFESPTPNLSYTVLFYCAPSGTHQRANALLLMIGPGFGSEHDADAWAKDVGQNCKMVPDSEPCPLMQMGFLPPLLRAKKIANPPEDSVGPGTLSGWHQRP